LIYGLPSGMDQNSKNGLLKNGILLICLQAEGGMMIMGKINGSPLIFLEKILEQESKLRKNGIKIKLFFIENTTKNFSELEKQIIRI